MMEEGQTFNDSYTLADLPGQIKKWRQLAREGTAWRYWLTDGTQYLGTIRLRREPLGHYPGLRSHVHYSISPSKRGKGYGKLILKLGLKKAKRLGFKNLIITSKRDNLGSIKIIEANGGKLLGTKTVLGDREKMKISKYRVRIA